MKIVGYVLQDIQSWDANSGTIPLAQDRMNVIIAPSETGKSVVIKILKEMCFAGNWGYTWTSLIKRGAKNGTAVFIMEDGSAVIYVIWPNKVRYAIMDKDPNVQPKIWEFSDPNHTEIPEEVANHLGIIVDRKGRTVINVLDKDMVTPFVTASPELNARIAAVITVVPEMEKRRESLREWQEQLKEAFRIVDNRLAGARTRYLNAPEIDILHHQIKLDKAEKLASFVEPLDILVSEIHPEQLPLKPDEVTCPDLDGLIDCLNLIDDLEHEYTELLSLVRPTELKLDEEVIEQIVDIHHEIDVLSIEFKQVITAVAPKEITLPEELTGILEYLQYVIECGELLRELDYLQEPAGACKEPKSIVADICNTMSSVSYTAALYNEMLNISEPIAPKQYDNVTMVVAVQKFIGQLPYVDLCKVIEDATNAHNTLDTVECELEKLRKELKVCPTCERPWT